MSAQENKALVTRAITAIDAGGDSGVIDEFFASTYVAIPLWPHPIRPLALEGAEGRELLKAGMAMERAAMPDKTTVIEEIVAEGDIVMVCTITRGTHTGGPYFDHPASGKTLETSAFVIYRIANGQIVESRALWDRLGAFQQMGIVPSQADLHQRTQAPTS